jgi:aconitate hydratase
MFLGVQGVFARSFARIHHANLFNFGLVPLTIDEATYERLEQGDEITIVDDVAGGVRAGQEEFTARVNDDWEFTADLDASPREREILADGGKLPHTKKQASSGGVAPADD